MAASQVSEVPSSMYFAEWKTMFSGVPRKGTSMVLDQSDATPVPVARTR